MSQIFIKVARQNDRVYFHIDGLSKGFVNLGLPVEDAKKLAAMINAAGVVEVGEMRINCDDAGLGGKLGEE